MNEVEFTILMPCLNEEKTIGYCIREAKSAIRHYGISAEILIADNGSSDASKEIAKKNGARVIEVPKKGYGNAVIGGIRAAKGRYIIMGDCDKSYDFKEIGRFIRPLRSGKQLVMGSRFAGGIEPGAMPLSHRYFGVPLLSFLGRLRYRTKVQDFHCGLRGFEKEAALALGLSWHGVCNGNDRKICRVGSKDCTGTGFPAKRRAAGPFPFKDDTGWNEAFTVFMPEYPTYVR